MKLWSTAALYSANELDNRRAGLPVPTVQEKLRARRLPARLLVDALDPAVETPALQFALRLLDGDGVLLVLSGPPGVGKSLAAAAALIRSAGGLWVDAPGLATPPMDGETTDRRMREAALLVLDDCGLEHSPSGYAASRICGVLDAREAELRPTIVTTNLTSSEFGDRYGARLASRLNGDPLGFQQIVGDDLRETRPRKATPQLRIAKDPTVP